MKDKLLRIMIMVSAIIAGLVVPASAGPVLIDFEGSYITGDFVDDNYLLSHGVSFTGAQYLSNSGPGYPPVSGINVIYNPSGPEIRVDFSDPVAEVSVWYTSADDIYGGNLDAYNNLDGLIGFDSDIANSDGLVGTNTKLVVSSSTANIDYVILHDTGDYITYDDFAFDTEPAVVGGGGGTQIPEFPTVALPIASVIGLMLLFHKRKQN